MKNFIQKGLTTLIALFFFFCGPVLAQETTYTLYEVVDFTPQGYNANWTRDSSTNKAKATELFTKEESNSEYIWFRSFINQFDGILDSTRLGRVIVKNCFGTSLDFSFKSSKGWCRINVNSEGVTEIWLKGTQVLPADHQHEDGSLCDVWKDVTKPKWLSVEKPAHNWIAELRFATGQN